MTNIIRFPGNARSASRMAGDRPYEFTQAEMATLCRWYSAMKYAFPAAEGVMSVCHRRRVSAIGLYGEGGGAPNCLLSKHERDGRSYILWAAEPDQPREIASIGDLIERQIGAIKPPRNERRWLDEAGWQAIVALGIAETPLQTA